jgi:hypothetical protein
MSYTDQKIVKSSLFLKIEQGAPHTIRLLDPSPTEQWQHRIDMKLTECEGDECAWCDEGHSRSQRFVANVFDHNDSKVYLWSYSPSVAELLKGIAISLNQDGENILNHDLEISAQGTGLQKKTNVQLRFKTLPIPSGIKKLKIGKSPSPLADSFAKKAETEVPF